MLKKTVSVLLLVISCTTLAAQQKMTVKDIIGKWQVTGLVKDDQTIPIESEEALRNFMYAETVKQKKEKKEDTGLTSDDSSGVEMVVKVLGMFRESEVFFLANKSIKLSLAMGRSKDEKGGTWAFNEAKQSITVTQAGKGKATKGKTILVFVRGSQLLMQMEKDKEEGFMLSKKK
jgi:hypothetical protein